MLVKTNSLTEAGVTPPVSDLTFQPINLEDAQLFLKKWHRAGAPTHGKFCFGAFSGSELIASTVFVNSRGEHERVCELMCASKHPDFRRFHISQLLSYCCKQLKKLYDLVVTYCDMGIGAMFKGSYWCYNGMVGKGDYSLTGPRLQAGRHLYWKSINSAGIELAKRFNLSALEYPNA